MSNNYLIEKLFIYCLNCKHPSNYLLIIPEHTHPRI
ncbi:hypothetical protein ING2E5A_2182 [Petrimonas mucosa]|uniref:Uncharacterized protein n=1 Tax=Petrimonas mucosa TaxID=1642646 RepID=A0A1G4G913_9BACT|nr:hypothetical protein ING2E5A_2182 [Petrimonas mucosa]